MRFGANYTPRKGWFHSWLDLDLSEVAKDFTALKSLGLDHVRIFPLWPLLQPNRTMIRRSAIDDVVSVVHVAADHGLEVVVDALQGHLSSYDFLPSWVSTWHRRNIFTDPQVRAAEAELVKVLAESLVDQPNAFGVSLGNEIIQFAAQRHPEAHVITQTEADEWLTQMLGQAQDVWPGGLHTFSFDDDLFFDTTHPFTPAQAVVHGDVTTVHSWVFTHLGQAVGRDHHSLPVLARYLCELAVAWTDDPGRQVWLQEVGAPINYVSTDQAPRFIRETIAHLQGLEQLWGVTWWCSHDVSRSLADYPELEYSLGLIDELGRIKPTGRALSEAITDWAPQPLTERKELTFDATDLVTARSATNPASPLFAEWAEHALAGRAPALRREQAVGAPDETSMSHALYSAN